MNRKKVVKMLILRNSTIIFLLTSLIILISTSGMAISNLLYFDKTYKVIQTNVMEPYVLNEEQYLVEFSYKNDRVTINNDVPDYIKDYERTEDKEIIITNLQLSLNTILQYPELPNGCEVTALASVLNYHGYKTTKMELAEKYL